jgi:hypothetical protein
MASRKRKAPKKLNNLDLLAKAKLIDPQRLTTREKNVIKQLRADEIKTLIKILDKLKGRDRFIPFLFF